MGDVGPIEYFIYGGVGGICTVLVGHPFDTVKVRLQTMPVPPPGKPPLYTGMMDCVKKTIAKEGFKGLYKGMGAPLAAITPIFAISFMGYKVGKTLIGPEDESKFKNWQYFLAGAFSGIFTTLFMAPGERIKCLLQIQADSHTKKYNGPIDCAVKLFKEGGIRSVYKGSGATLGRDVPAAGLYFLTYEVIRNFLTNRGEKPLTMYGTILAGGCAGTSNWLIGMPFDVIKSRIQTAAEGQKTGMKFIFLDLLQNEGPLALYKGIIPVLVRAFPANAACFVGFECCRRLVRTIIPIKDKKD